MKLREREGQRVDPGSVSITRPSSEQPADVFCDSVTDKIKTHFCCEAQGKGRAKGRPRKVTKRSFMDGGWWLVVYLSLMLYIKFG